MIELGWSVVLLLSLHNDPAPDSGGQVELANIHTGGSE